MGLAARAFVVEPQQKSYFFEKCIRLIAAFIFLCSITGFFQFLFPLADLFNHFRIQAVAGLFLCLLVVAALKDKKGILFCIFALSLNLFLVGQKLYQTGGIPRILEGQKPSLSIISSNVLTSNTQHVAVLDMVKREDPDFIVFTEVDETWLKNLEPIEKTYKYTFKYPSSDNFGIAAYSKKPFEGSVKFSGGAGLPILIAKLQDGMTIIGVHPLPPSSERNMTESRIYLGDVSSLSTAKTGAVVVAGDFNSTLWSPILNPLIKSGLKRINSLGIAHTWPTNDRFLAIQIDHFFAKNVHAADFAVLPSVGSDHYPIRADLVY